MHASSVEPGGPRYSDAEAAALYDVLNPWGASDDFYLGLIMQAASVVDVGCGTGALLHRARAAGHRGRLCGVDPDPAMLAVARRREDVEWDEATAAEMRFEREFELAVMTGHAFQVLTTDDGVRASLSAIRRALVEGGRFAFETRNPERRAWEDWRNAELEATDQRGRELCVWYDVEEVVGDVVTLTETTGYRDHRALRVDRGSLRFLSVEALDAFLAEAGLVVEERFGGWRQEPFQEDSEEIVTIARAVEASAPV